MSIAFLAGLDPTPRTAAQQQRAKAIAPQPPPPPPVPPAHLRGRRRLMRRLAVRDALTEMVRARRLELGLTQFEVADRIDTTGAYISQVETGAVAPTDTTLLRIADALGLPHDAVLAAGAAHRLARAEHLDAVTVQPAGDDMASLLLYHRIRAGYTQPGLARAIGVQQWAVQQIERGHRRTPPPTGVLEALERVLKLPEGTLVDAPWVSREAASSQGGA